MDYLITIVIAFIIIDSIFFGFLMRIFRISQPYRMLLKEGVVFEDKLPGYLHGLKPGGYYKSIVLTPTYFIFAQNYFTSVRCIRLNSIYWYSIQKSKVLSRKKKIGFSFNEDGKSAMFEIKTKRLDEWIDALSKVNLNEKDNPR